MADGPTGAVRGRTERSSSEILWGQVTSLFHGSEVSQDTAKNAATATPRVSQEERSNRTASDCVDSMTSPRRTTRSLSAQALEGQLRGHTLTDPALLPLGNSLLMAGPLLEQSEVPPSARSGSACTSFASATQNIPYELRMQQPHVFCDVVFALLFCETSQILRRSDHNIWPWEVLRFVCSASLLWWLWHLVSLWAFLAKQCMARKHAMYFLSLVAASWMVFSCQWHHDAQMLVVYLVARAAASGALWLEVFGRSAARTLSGPRLQQARATVRGYCLLFVFECPLLIAAVVVAVPRQAHSGSSQRQFAYAALWLPAVLAILLCRAWMARSTSGRLVQTSESSGGGTDPASLTWMLESRERSRLLLLVLLANAALGGFAASDGSGQQAPDTSRTFLSMVVVVSALVAGACCFFLHFFAVPGIHVSAYILGSNTATAAEHVHLGLTLATAGVGAAFRRLLLGVQTPAGGASSCDEQALLCFSAGAFLLCNATLQCLGDEASSPVLAPRLPKLRRCALQGFVGACLLLAAVPVACGVCLQAQDLAAGVCVSSVLLLVAVASYYAVQAK